MPLGASNLRALPDVGTAIYTAPGGKTIIKFGFGNFADTPVCIVILSDGSIVQVNTSTLMTASVAPAGTITTPTQQAIGISQWGSQYILICSSQTNGYFIWDGTVFYKSGTIGPSVNFTNAGSDYTSAPTIVAVGGEGTGATFSSVVNNGAIEQITVTAAGSGYRDNDVVVLRFNGGGNAYATATAVASISNGVVTAITVASGGSGYSAASIQIAILGGNGEGASATATVSATTTAVTSIAVTSGGLGYTNAPTVYITDPNNPVAQALVPIMPFGIQGTVIETYTSRVWIANGAALSTPPVKSLVNYGAPGNPEDFNPADGAGNFIGSDSFIRVGYHGLKQSNGFLYLVGDSSVNYISGVVTSGNPPVTTFSNQNVDPQVGSPWPDTVAVFSRAIVMANSFGVHSLYGGAVNKVSTALDGIYTSVSQSNFGSFYPSGAVAIVFGIHVYMLLLPIVNTYTDAEEKMLLMWDGQRWWVADQSVALEFINSQEINSIITAYGTDGMAIYPLFQTPSTNTQKVVQSKLWSNPTYAMDKQAFRVFGIIENNSTNPISVPIDIHVDGLNSSQILSGINLNKVTFVNNLNQTVTFMNNSSQVVDFTSNGNVFVRAGASEDSVLLGLTLQSNAEDFTVVSLTLLASQRSLQV